MKKRETIILELLSEQGRIIVRREHGYAVFGGSDDINNRLAINYEQKRRHRHADIGAVTVLQITE